MHSTSKIGIHARIRRIREIPVGCAIAFLAAIAGWTGTARPLSAQSKPGEYQVKAVYLYNFAKFIDWPPRANQKDDAFTVCVLGRDPFGQVLDATLAGDAIANKKTAARRVTSVRDASCDILYIAASEAGRIRQILATIDKPGVLTVSDVPEFTAAGGIIQFVVVEDKIRFEVNLAAAQKAGLTISSQLLKVATAVRNNTPKADNAP